MSVRLAYQTADVENATNNATAFGNEATSNGVLYPGEWADLSPDTDGVQLVRFGFMVYNATVTNRTWARVGGFVEISDI